MSGQGGGGGASRNEERRVSPPPPAARPAAARTYSVGEDALGRGTAGAGPEPR